MVWVAWVTLGCGSTDGSADAVDVDRDDWPLPWDCDDANPDVHPTAAERCNGADDNCDGVVDGAAVDATVWFEDADRDGAGSVASFRIGCDPLEGFVSTATDCDDGRAEIHPGAAELCNGLDDNCDGQHDEGCPDEPPPIGERGTWAVSTVESAHWMGALDNPDGDRLWGGQHAGDLDGDGVDDLVFGGQDADEVSVYGGMLFIVYGAATLPTGTLDPHTLPRFEGTSALTIAQRLAAGGDLDGDGRSDVVVAGSGQGFSGAAYVLYGSATRESGLNDVSGFDASFTGRGGLDAETGAAVTFAGDLDGDGFDDVAFAGFENSTAFNEATVYLLYGGPTRASGPSLAYALPRIRGGSEDDLGFALGGITGADLDGDGLSDLVMEANGASPWYMAVLYGEDLRPSFVDASALPWVDDTDLSATTVKAGGDVDGDGYPDLLVADDFEDTYGLVYVVGGGARWVGTTDIDDASVATIYGVNYATGSAAVGVGDVTGDGEDDIAVSCGSWDEPYENAGAVGIFAGSLAGAIRFDEADVVIGGAYAGDGLGGSVTAVDLDGNGALDLVVGGTAPFPQGRVSLIAGPF